MIDMEFRRDLHAMRKGIYKKARLLNLLASRSILTSYLRGSREFNAMMIQGRSALTPGFDQETPYGKLLKSIYIGVPGIVLTEGRMLPLAVCCSNLGTPVFLAGQNFSQFEVTCRELFLAGLPPLVSRPSTEEVKSDRFSIKEGMADGDVLRFSCEGIAVGLQAVESALRGLPLQRSVREFHDKALSRAEDKLEPFTSTLDRAADFSEKFSIGMNISAHDAYLYSSINEIMASKARSICVPKGMYNPVIEPRQKFFEVNGKCIFSRRRNDFISCINRISNGVEVEDTRSVMLPYMKNSPQHNQEKKGAVAHIVAQTGLSNLSRVEGLRVFGKSSEAPKEGSHIWVFALQSFADTACIWGNDEFLSHQGFFYELARKVSSLCSDNVIVFRPHPNMLFDPKRTDAAATSRMDMVEQISLINHIQDQGGRVYLSDASQPMDDILMARRVSIVTRWGSAGVEALLAGKNVLCSPVAPYAVVEHPNLYLAEGDLSDVLQRMTAETGCPEPKQSVVNWLNGYQYLQKYKEDGSPRGKSAILSPEYSRYVKAINAFQRSVFPEDSIWAKKLISASVDFRNRVYHEAENEDFKDILNEYLPRSDAQQGDA